MNIHKILSNPKTRIKLTFLGIIIITFFYVSFRPFQMAHYAMNDLIFVNGAYIIISAVVLFCYLILFPFYFKKKYLKLISTVQARLGFLVLILLNLGISFFSFKVLFGYYDFSFERILTGFLAFIALSVFPIMVLKFVDTDNSSTSTEGSLFISKNKGYVRIEDILYIYSDKNYVIWICNIKGKMELLRVRETLVSVENRLQSQHKMKRTHRAFLVNICKIKQIDKNAGSYLISIKNCSEKIPLSRNFRSEFSGF